MFDHVFPSKAFSFLIITISFIHISNPVLSDENFTICSKNFECGDQKNIGYPFWGSTRPKGCGHPDFELDCSGEYPEMIIKDTKYRVLGIDNTAYTMKIVRRDYADNLCPESRETVSFDFSHFVYYMPQTTQNITLYYDCTNKITDASWLSYSSNFDCSGGVGFNYYVVQNSSFNPSLDDMLKEMRSSYMSCKNTVDVTVTSFPLQTPPVEPSSTSSDDVAKAVAYGFTVKWWTGDDNLCFSCNGLKGQCGNIDGKFMCYCPDNNAACDEFQRSLPGHKKKNHTVLIAGLSIVGAVIAGLVVTILLLRRKKIAAQFKSRGLLKSSLGEGTSTTTTNHSRTVPSYLSSSISDLEKGASNYFGVQVFTYAELEEATENFDESKELGDGGFGTVYHGVLKDGRAVAVKRLYENHLKRVEQFMNEVEILKRLRHPNLVILFGCTSRRSRELLLVYEYISNGTVADHLHGNRAQSGLLTWPIRLKIAVETASALSYLHISDVIHRDVKTNNILLDKHFCVKVADFGLSRLFPTDVTHISTAPQGTPGYVDPEYYQCYQLTGKSDVYSFGVVLVELISSKEAVDITRHRHDINLANMAVTRIQNQALHEIVDPTIGFETDSVTRRKITLVAELAFRCLQQERDMRPSMSEVLDILRGIENDEFDVRKPDVVDIGDDDVGLLRSIPPPLSPDSIAPDHSNWASSSSTINSA